MYTPIFYERKTHDIGVCIRFGGGRSYTAEIRQLTILGINQSDVILHIIGISYINYI